MSDSQLLTSVYFTVFFKYEIFGSWWALQSQCFKSLRSLQTVNFLLIWNATFFLPMYGISIAKRHSFSLFYGQQKFCLIEFQTSQYTSTASNKIKSPERCLRLPLNFAGGIMLKYATSCKRTAEVQTIHLRSFYNKMMKKTKTSIAIRF